MGDKSPFILKRANWFVHDQIQALVLRAAGARRHNEKVEYCYVYFGWRVVCRSNARTAAIHVRKNVR